MILITLFVLFTLIGAISKRCFKLLKSPSSDAHNRAVNTKSSPFYFINFD